MQLPFFDPRFQPIGVVGQYTLTQRGLADGNAKIFRPYFDDSSWWGDLESYDIDNAAVFAATPNWSARALLDARTYTTRRIFTVKDDGNAEIFEVINDLSPLQRTALGSQDFLDFVRGDTSNEGGLFRPRNSVMGDVVHSAPVYVEYDAATLANNRVFIGANDGMLHSFNASTGAEEFAFIPNAVYANLNALGDQNYADDHRYFVDGTITIRKITLDDGTKKRALVGALGGGGQAFYALDVTSTDVFTDANLTDKLLWEISDTSTGMSDLGFSFSRPLIVKVHDGSGGAEWVAVFGNGYGNTIPDGTIGSGTAVLYIVDLRTGALIKKFDTLAGGSNDPNGLSSPSIEDINSDDIADYIYAGDLNGNLWRFDLTDTDPSNWHIAFNGDPFFSAVNGQGDRQPITTPPRVLRHPNGGLLVMFGTGSILWAQDIEPNNDPVQSVYGLRDPLDGTQVVIGDLVIQSLTESALPDLRLVRTSSAYPVPTDTKSGWVVDLVAGERVVTNLQVRTGRLVFTSTNPTITGGEVWVNEIDALTGSAPRSIVYDMNADGVLDTDDNIDGNTDGDVEDLEDIVSGLHQGGGIVVSAPTLVNLSATSGTYFINRINHSEVEPPATGGPGVAGGHFDVDTSSEISKVGNGRTDAHVHEYDDKYDVVGVDYFNFLSTNLHEITEDVQDTTQKFKIIVANEHLSTGGRLVINNTYDGTDTSTYTTVGTHGAISHSLLPIYTLDVVAGATQMTQFGMYFDRNAIIDHGLVPTQTGCVKTNTRATNGEWRNGALTTWAVEINADGTDNYTLEYDVDDPTKIVGITSGMLWENTLFWHWKGPCAHEYDHLDAFVLIDGKETGEQTVFEYYAAITLDAEAQKAAKAKKKSKKRKNDDDDGGGGGGDGVPETPPVTADISQTWSPSGDLSTPDRTYWSEVRN